PSITSSKDVCITIASAALDKAISMLQSSGQFNGAFHSVYSITFVYQLEFDRLTKQMKYKQTLKQGIALAESVNSEFSSALNYEYAAARAYTVYRDSDFLALAVTSWTTARRYTISKDQAASGTMDVKQFNLLLSRQGGKSYPWLSRLTSV
ncbi:hypothetical protein ARMGADRAFT_940991, partial [Armillaria gallica]